MKTVFEMALETGIHAEYTPGMIPLLERFAELVRADEREACAEVAEQYGPNRPIVATQPSERIKGQWEGEQAASSGIAAVIRSRG